MAAGLAAGCSGPREEARAAATAEASASSSGKPSIEPSSIKPSVAERRRREIEAMTKYLDSELYASTSTEVNAYGHALRNLPRERWDDVRAGKEIFIASWVEPGGAEALRDVKGPGARVLEGLGPQFNATSCESCHYKDGRSGKPPTLQRPSEAHDATYLPPPPDAPMLLLRLGVAGADGALGSEPTYGWQLQDRALPGHRPEGSFSVNARRSEGRYRDGARFTLEAPVVTLGALRDGPLHPEARRSLRQPLSLIGLGLLEAVPDETLLALADPEDRDRDGISGRPNQLRDPRGGLVVGRFGWKAGQPSLRVQNATALREDLGVSTSLYPDAPCRGAPAPRHSSSSSHVSPPSSSSGDCTASPLGAPHELSDADLELLTRYLRLLEPPARRSPDRAAPKRGEALFASFGCAACHVPELTTGDVADLPELSRRTFSPYTDLLLHDMGEGLADDRPEGAATGREWRTPPLWGLGYLDAITRTVHLLHDGRARTVAEAILWHGGEARAARDAFANAAAADRAELLRFLDSL